MINLGTGKVLVIKSNSLTFEVAGIAFPNYTFINRNNAFAFSSSIQQTVTVNWGDGTFSPHDFVWNPLTETFEVAWTQEGENRNYPDESRVPKHTYQDSEAGDRLITFNFDDLSKIEILNSRAMLLQGSLPSDLMYAKDLERLIIVRAEGITVLPSGLRGLNKLKQINLERISPTKFDKIPDRWFDFENIETFSVSGTFDLSDPIASNAFKIGQFENLIGLSLKDTNLTELDDGILSSKDKMIGLSIDGNDLTEMPIFLEEFTKLEAFKFGRSGDQTAMEMISFDKWENLESLELNGTGINISDLAVKWKGLVSLKRIDKANGLLGVGTIGIPRVDEFITQLYSLVTDEASILPNGAAAPYPDRFRDIEWGHGSVRYTGSVTQPTGYNQGVSNGTPATPGEMVYVLKFQYGHDITPIL